MKKILLDTSAYSNYLRGHEGVRGWIRNADEIYVNAIVIGELLAGFVKGRHEEKNREHLEKFLASDRVHIISISETTSERYAAIFKTLKESGKPIPTNDIWISASAMEHGLELVSCDSDFLAVKQVISHVLEVQNDSI